MNELEIAAGLAPTPGYRYASVVGDQLFVAGQVPLDAAGTLVGSDVAVQTGQCLENLDRLVAVHGFARADVRHLTIHVVGDQDDLSLAWETTRNVFDGEVPPATLLGAARLGYRAQLVEIDATIMRS